MEYTGKVPSPHFSLTGSVWGGRDSAVDCLDCLDLLLLGGSCVCTRGSSCSLSMAAPVLGWETSQELPLEGSFSSFILGSVVCTWTGKQCHPGIAEAQKYLEMDTGVTRSLPRLSWVWDFQNRDAQLTSVREVLSSESPDNGSRQHSSLHACGRQSLVLSTCICTAKP